MHLKSNLLILLNLIFCKFKIHSDYNSHLIFQVLLLLISIYPGANSFCFLLQDYFTMKCISQNFWLSGALLKIFQKSHIISWQMLISDRSNKWCHQYWEKSVPFSWRSKLAMKKGFKQDSIRMWPRTWRHFIYQ